MVAGNGDAKGKHRTYNNQDETQKCMHIMLLD